MVKVFVRCSDKKTKVKRIVEEYGIAPELCETTRNRFDHKRKKYYYANTAKQWDDLKNYDIVLDSASLGIDGCVAILKGIMMQVMS